jgi:hypothetical protein
MRYIVRCVVVVKYARKKLYESRYCEHMLICDPFCCLYSGVYTCSDHARSPLRLILLFLLVL